MRSYTMDRLLRSPVTGAFIKERRGQWLQKDTGVKWCGGALFGQ
jgi:hypothetical protein